MPVIETHKDVPWTPEQMFALVSDVARYPEFLPWCAGARIRNDERDGNCQIMTADLIIKFKVFRETFTSRVINDPKMHEVTAKAIDGPFHHLENHWAFPETAGGGTRIDFYCDFEFRGAVPRRLISLLFEEVMRRIVAAFEARAEELYGQPDKAGSGSAR